ncbi:hypothetical protein Rhal01_02811 [Rubritalea halochordaticola]|uniref:Plasmid maintenance system killer protein n=1 Tax=Rubritalea halochordaticola TaxID=714537 RepID=A0ABP9V698_9BACT
MLLEVIKSFANRLTQKIFDGEPLTKKDRKTIGALKVEKAQQSMLILNASTEKELLQFPSLRYHRLRGTSRFSIDTVRNSKWRITFAWEDEEMKDVELVKIEDAHA